MQSLLGLVLPHWMTSSSRIAQSVRIIEVNSIIQEDQTPKQGKIVSLLKLLLGPTHLSLSLSLYPSLALNVYKSEYISISAAINQYIYIYHSLHISHLLTASLSLSPSPPY